MNVAIKIYEQLNAWSDLLPAISLNGKPRELDALVPKAIYLDRKSFYELMSDPVSRPALQTRDDGVFFAELPVYPVTATYPTIHVYAERF